MTNAANPKNVADTWMSIGEYPKNTIVAAAPKEAPWETPKNPGSTNGLAKSSWNTNPAQASIAPPKMANNTLGRRRSRMIDNIMGSPVIASAIAIPGWGYLPASNDIRMANSNNTTSISTLFLERYNVCLYFLSWISWNESDMMICISCMPQ